MGTCSQCERKSHARGLCAKHYQVDRRRENPEIAKANARKRYAKNPEPIKASASAWAKENRARKTLVAREWEKANPDRMRAKKSKYSAENKEKISKSAKVYYSNNAEAIKAKCSSYIKNNPELARAKAARRRALKRSANGSHTKEDIKNLVSMQRGCCACCTKRLPSNYHVDHIIPLSKGGSNDRLNLQILCEKCNLTKHTKDPIEFMQSQGMLI